MLIPKEKTNERNPFNCIGTIRYCYSYSNRSSDMDSKCKDITRHKGTMTVEYNFHSRDGKPKPKQEPPKQEIDQTNTTPKEKFIVGALLIVVVGYLVLSIMDII